MKQISMFADEQEYADFLLIKAHFDRKTESDTIRAMISYCKKILPSAISFDITNQSLNNASPSQPDLRK